MSDALAALQRAERRLADGEPVRLLIGHTLHQASEITPVGAFSARLRRQITAEIAALIAELQPPDPIAPQGALPVQRSAL